MSLRNPLPAVLTVAVCAVLAGTTSFTAITDWLYDLDEADQQRLGFTWGVPASSRVWRLLTRRDAALVSGAGCRLAGFVPGRHR
jgi:hypothetical protein